MKKGYFYETLGTTILLFVGCGSLIFASTYTGTLGSSAIFAITWVVLYYLFRGKCECSFNPALSIGIAISGKTKYGSCIGNIICQLIGCVLSVVLLSAILLLTSSGIYGLQPSVNGYDTYSPIGVSMIGIIIFELVGTILYVLAFIFIIKRKNKSNYVGIIFGIVLLCLIMVGSSVDGACYNPVRALSPAIIVAGTGQFDILIQSFVFVGVTTVAGILGGLIYKLIYRFFE